MIVHCKDCKHLIRKKGWCNPTDVPIGKIKNPLFAVDYWHQCMWFERRGYFKIMTTREKHEHIRHIQT
jgi:hypothetical protein